MNSLDEWYRTLDQLGKRPKWQKNGREIRASCPAHPATSDDGLSVTEKDGKVLAHCFSSCSYEAIRDAVGFEKPSGPPPPKRPRPKAENEEPEPPPQPRALPSGPEWWAPWIYTDAGDTPVLAVVRKDLGWNAKTGRMRKTFRQFTPAPDEPGLWLPKSIEYARPLYRLPKILAAPVDATICVAEGEKCAEAALAAWPEKHVTCWSGGANDQWKCTDWRPLARHNVELLADGNEVGHACMLAVAKHLTAIDCRVKVALPDKDGTDVADWLQQDHPDAVEAKIQAMLESYDASMLPGFPRFLELSADWVNLPAADELPPPIIERTDGKMLLYANKLNAIFGQPGGGKSWIGLQALVLTVLQGGRVLWLDFEDRPATFQDRARALGFEPREHHDSHKWLPPTIMEDDEQQAFAAAVAWVSEYEGSLVVIDAATQAGCPPTVLKSSPGIASMLTRGGRPT